MLSRANRASSRRATKHPGLLASLRGLVSCLPELPQRWLPDGRGRGAGSGRAQASQSLPEDVPRGSQTFRDQREEERDIEEHQEGLQRWT